jgi:hypothetical protein
MYCAGGKASSTKVLARLLTINSKLDFGIQRNATFGLLGVVMVFFDPAATGNNPTSAPENKQPPQQIVVDPPWNVFRPPNRLRFN